MAIPYLDCMVLAAQLYALPPRVLPSIQAVEGGQVGVLHRNRDGSADLGVMQVNTRWIRPLAHMLNLPQDTILERLITDACFNINVAGVIMRSYLNETHGDLLRAVAYYHSHTPTIGTGYRIRVETAAARLFVIQASRGATVDETAHAASEAAEHVLGVPPPIDPIPRIAAGPVAVRPAALRPVAVHHVALHRVALQHVAVRQVTLQQLAGKHAAIHVTAQHASAHHVTSPADPAHRTTHSLDRRTTAGLPPAERDASLRP